MKLFAKSFTEAMETEHITYRDLEAKIGVTHSNLSKYGRGDLLPKDETLRAIVKEFPKHAVPLIRAWVRERLGEDLSDVATESLTGNLTKIRETECAFEDLPADFLAALEGLAKLGRKHPDLRTALIHLHLSLTKQLGVIY